MRYFPVRLLSLMEEKMYICVSETYSNILVMPIWDSVIGIRQMMSQYSQIALIFRKELHF